MMVLGIELLQLPLHRCASYSSVHHKATGISNSVRTGRLAIGRKMAAYLNQAPFQRRGGSRTHADQSVVNLSSLGRKRSSACGTLS